jgi:hypothetical protein
MYMKRTLLALLSALVTLPQTAWSQSCSAGPVAVQILGSGGPAVNNVSDASKVNALTWHVLP